MIIANPAIPPTTPPTIAPIFTELPEVVGVTATDTGTTLVEVTVVTEPFLKVEIIVETLRELLELNEVLDDDGVVTGGVTGG